MLLTIPRTAGRDKPKRGEGRPLPIRCAAAHENAASAGVNEGLGETVKIAYLVGHYPAISHTFILREVEGLRARGVEIETISVHRVAEDQLLNEAERREHASTYTILPPRWGDLVRAHLSALLRAPSAYLSTLGLSLRLSRPGLRGRLWQLFYFAEAMVVWKRCEARGFRHLHAQFTNQVTDIALLATHYESGANPRWTLELHRPWPGRVLRGLPLQPPGQGRERRLRRLHQRLRPQPADGTGLRGALGEAARDPLRDRSGGVRASGRARRQRRPSRFSVSAVSSPSRARAC